MILFEINNKQTDFYGLAKRGVHIGTSLCGCPFLRKQPQFMDVYYRFNIYKPPTLRFLNGDIIPEL